MTTEIQPQPGIMEISLYQGGKANIEGASRVIKLSSNENPFGPSEKAIEAYRRAAHELHRYPPTDHRSLREAIGAVHGLDPDKIICGVGSDEIITFLCQAYAGQGDEVIFTEHGFSMYRISALAAGATPIEVPERERVADVESILAACNEKTRLVFIANPNNPTGTMIGGNDVARLAAGLPPQALLVLDGAYAEYVEGFDGGAALVEARENVFMTRTFSKLYGLGGLRIGWGYGPKEIIDVLNRIRGPFNLSQPQLDAAEAALKDRAYVEKCRTENTRMRAWLAEALAELGVPSDTSCANFILARFADQAEAEACDDYLQSQGLLVRRVAGYNLPNCLRITVGDEASCRRVAHAVAGFKALEK
ncbi:histidinol-phosphate transaminase [Pseudohalocynthiibacter aestuariivivens]|jgi:histidinol-phosphate aminotransferase|uniref:Histidinol-phosphate aminotransferase n=1 Tax=Pseudohalocynthiibacter aestuariivivens TaxID=1591409 RepID=A0ABV5JCV8_9RHOB|nr:MULTISPECIES: histidinol-phosphate transaminase [Pseudohalocynthiibacter]MBS9717225.1 histidinol-phosphate transaminase [Pseudohalocynthiibacter aestuariivivens]MCK0103671.1 histidinol-phosphate transaminase [Pseudohalocynthiibacter sp. F2068]